MAKKSATRVGGGDAPQQIANLEKEVGAAGVKRAKELAQTEPTAVIKLAFKYVRKTEKDAGPGGLGSRLEELIAALPKEVQAERRAEFLAAKAKKNAAKKS